jgi:outer membrane protein TolC
MALCAQRINQVPDSLRKKPTVPVRGKISKIDPAINDRPVSADDEIKARLIRLALNNPQVTIDNSNIEIAELNRKKASSSWLSSLSVTGNVNEFVINNSPAANFFPKYNLGIAIPFNIFSATANEKRVADENIKIANALKIQNENILKAEVLSRYETFKEQKDLLALQNITVENHYSDYQAAQKNFSDGLISIDELNKFYQVYISEKVKVISINKEYNVAKILVEQLIGLPLENALQGLYTE